MKSCRVGRCRASRQSESPPKTPPYAAGGVLGVESRSLDRDTGTTEGLHLLGASPLRLASSPPPPQGVRNLGPRLLLALCITLALMGAGKASAAAADDPEQLAVQLGDPD